MARRPQNPLALAVLTLLAEQPMHPYEMSRTLKERHKEDSIKLNYGSLYSVVDSLDKRGLIEVQETVREGNRPERTVYAITEPGRQLMDEWLRDLLSVPAKEYPQFEAALSLMAILPPEQVLPLLEERLARLRRDHEASAGLLREITDAGLPRVFTIEHEYELALLRAQLDFVASLVEDLRAERFGGLDLWRGFHELRAAGVPAEEIQRRAREQFPEAFPAPDGVDDLT